MSQACARISRRPIVGSTCSAEIRSGKAKIRRVVVDKDLEKLQELICADIWKKTYRLSDSDADAAKEIEKSVAQSAEPGDTAHSNWMYGMKLLFGTKWLHCGRVQLVVGQK